MGTPSVYISSTFEDLKEYRAAVFEDVVPENSTGIEIVELIGVGFSRHVPDVAFVPAILSFVFPKSGRSPDRDPRLTTPDRCASTTDSKSETEILRSTFLGRPVSILVP